MVNQSQIRPIFRGVDVRPVYTIKNKEKFIGDKVFIHYENPREFELMDFLDNNKNIILWNYKSIGIKFINKSNNKKGMFIRHFMLFLKQIF